MLGGKNKQQHRPLGYTIVEVMIVLAVSGMMFVIAASFINGKQQRAAFTQGSNDTVSIMQNIVEDITDGHYSDVPINCIAANPDGTAIRFLTGTPSAQGANPQCVFMGKLIHFYISGTAQPQNYNVFSLAAARTTNPNPGVAAIQPPAIGSTLTTQSIIPQRLYVVRMHVIDTSGTDHSQVYNIGFKQSSGTVTDVAAGSYQSGAQTVSLIYATTLDKASAGSESNIVNDTTTTNVQSAKSATICLSNGAQYAVIFIGGTNDNQLSITIQQFGTTNPGPPLC